MLMEDLLLDKPRKFQLYHSWMSQHLSQQEILLEEEHRKTPAYWGENIPKEAHMYKKPPYHEGGSIQEKVVMMIMLVEGHIGIGDPQREGDIQVKVEGHLIKEDIRIEDLLGEDIPIEMEDLQEEEDTMEEDPLIVEDPLMEMEDPLEMEDPPGLPCG